MRGISESPGSASSPGLFGFGPRFSCAPSSVDACLPSGHAPVFLVKIPGFWQGSRFVRYPWQIPMFENSGCLHSTGFFVLLPHGA